jgi:ABC-type multidrug transport system fused ATPase/permease subunit
VVGPSGAGKSTLAAVLVGFLPVQAGSITVSGVPAEQLSGDDQRRVVGLVGQDAYLFDTTVGENLRVGRRDATDEQLHDVLDRVGLAAWLGDLPEGLGTEVGSHGARLSGGQRQRLAVARALLADFPVLVLDEPGEHLEPAAADALTADLLDVTVGHSLVLITHRLAGLEAVDEILVLEQGGVVQRGTHDELLDQAGRYSDLWWEEMRTERDARRPEEPRPHGPPPSASGSADREVALNDGSFTS